MFSFGLMTIVTGPFSLQTHFKSICKMKLPARKRLLNATHSPLKSKQLCLLSFFFFYVIILFKRNNVGKFNLALEHF